MLTLDCENSCRICLLESPELTSIFEEQLDNRKLNEILKELAGIEIENEDKLSKKICEECKLKTLDYSAFRQLCIDSDETVRYNLLLDDQEESLDKIEEVNEFNTVEEVEEVFQLAVQEESIIEEERIHENEDQEYEMYHIEELADESMDDKAASCSNKMILVKESINDSTSYQFDSSDETLTQQMKAAHFAKEQLKRHKCPYCSKSFMFPSKVNRHVLAVHKDLTQPKKVIKKNHCCHVCGKAFVSQFKVRRHMVVHDTEIKTGLQKNWTRNYFLCQHCLRKFHTKATYDRHTIICDLLMKSEIQREPNYLYHCAICSENFKQHDDMADHMKNLHHQNAEHEIIKCQLCESFTGNISDIVRHGRYHEENATYKCSVCQKLYPNGDEIISHLLRHANYRPFPCTHSGCEKRFFDRYKLKSHQASHDPNTEKKYDCKECSKTFAHLDYLNCHIRRKHSSIRPYNCSYCSKSFAFHHDLNLHLSVHTGNKKHNCPICMATFTKAWSLKQHMILHEVNPLQLQCPFCTCSFSALSKAQFNKHLASHNEKISLVCEECNIEFKSEEELKLHMEEVHQSRYAFIDDTDANSSDPYSTLVEIPNNY